MYGQAAFLVSVGAGWVGGRGRRHGGNQSINPFTQVFNYFSVFNPVSTHKFLVKARKKGTRSLHFLDWLWCCNLAIVKNWDSVPVFWAPVLIWSSDMYFNRKGILDFLWPGRGTWPFSQKQQIFYFNKVSDLCITIINTTTLSSVWACMHALTHTHTCTQTQSCLLLLERGEHSLILLPYYVAKVLTCNHPKRP